jgi:hypothetical protein
MLFENNRRKGALANGLSEAQMLSKQREKRDKEMKEEANPNGECVRAISEPQRHQLYKLEKSL